jgi:hypothetical protein
MLQPQAVPNSAGLPHPHPDRSRRLRLSGSRWADNALALRDVAEMLHELSLDRAVIVDHDSDEGERTHDDFFHIGRVAGDAVEIFFRTAVWANWALLEDLSEAPFTIDTAKLDALDDALRTVQAWVLGVPATSGTRIASWTAASAEYRSARRWIRGHQIFAALTQGLIVAFADLRSALAADDAAAVESAVTFVETMLAGSAAALEFTGDMPPADYAGLIRPQMKPPFVPETFSGLLSSDHRFLIGFLRQIKPFLDMLQQRNPAGHARIKDALGGVYDSHIFVCDRLVGKAPSLMMSAASAKTGPEQLAVFKDLRLKAFSPQRARPASPEPTHAATKEDLTITR